MAHAKLGIIQNDNYLGNDIMFDTWRDRNKIWVQSHSVCIYLCKLWVRSIYDEHITNQVNVDHHKLVSEPMTDCPLCHKKTFIIRVEKEHVVNCVSGCLKKVVKSGETEKEAMDKFAEFLTELEMGADLWGSKIRDGVVED